MVVWSVTSVRFLNHPVVRLFSDEEAALDASFEIREAFTKEGLTFKEGTVYIERHIVVPTDKKES